MHISYSLLQPPCFGWMWINPDFNFSAVLLGPIYIYIIFFFFWLGFHLWELLISQENFNEAAGQIRVWQTLCFLAFQGLCVGWVLKCNPGFINNIFVFIPTVFWWKTTLMPGKPDFTWTVMDLTSIPVFPFLCSQVTLPLPDFLDGVWI